MNSQTIGGRDAEAHRRHIKGMARLANRPEEIAERAAQHRAKAEAHMEFATMQAAGEIERNADHYEQAMREYALAYAEEN